MTCLAGSQLGGSNFCVEACDPAQPVSDPNYTCMTSGGLLQRCHPGQEASRPFRGLPAQVAVLPHRSARGRRRLLDDARVRAGFGLQRRSRAQSLCRDARARHVAVARGVRSGSPAVPPGHLPNGRITVRERRELPRELLRLRSPASRYLRPQLRRQPQLSTEPRMQRLAGRSRLSAGLHSRPGGGPLCGGSGLRDRELSGNRRRLQRVRDPLALRVQPRLRAAERTRVELQYASTGSPTRVVAASTSLLSAAAIAPTTPAVRRASAVTGTAPTRPIPLTASAAFRAMEASPVPRAAASRTSASPAAREDVFPPTSGCRAPALRTAWPNSRAQPLHPTSAHT